MGVRSVAFVLALLLATGTTARQDPAFAGFSDTTIRIGVEAAVGSLSLDGENPGFRPPAPLTW